MEIEVQIILLVMVEIISIVLALDQVDPMTSQVRVVVPQMILMKVAQIFNIPLNFKENVDMFDILNNMCNWNKV